MGSKNRPKKEAVPARSVGGSFKKPGDLPMRLVLGGLRKEQIFTPSCQNPKSLYRGLNRVQSCLPDGISSPACPDGLNNTLLSQVCVPEAAFRAGRQVECTNKP